MATNGDLVVKFNVTASIFQLYTICQLPWSTIRIRSFVDLFRLY